LHFFIGIPASLQSEFALTLAGSKNPGHVTIGSVRQYLFTINCLLFLASLPLLKKERVVVIGEKETETAASADAAHAHNSYHVMLPLVAIE
jgi:hypothetical protein